MRQDAFDEFLTSPSYPCYGGPYDGKEKERADDIMYVERHDDGHYHWCDDHQRYEWHQVDNRHGKPPGDSGGIVEHY